MSENRSDDDEPLTKTKLFTLGEDGGWTDMGVGIASVADDIDNGMPILRLDIVTIPLPEEQEEVLLSTPVSTEDIYTVQKGSILVWCDPELGRDMAASFHSKEGCSFIVDKIKDYQLGIRRRKEEAMAAAAAAQQQQQQNNNGAGRLQRSATVGSGSTLLDEASSDPLAYSSPWSICKVNLPAIARALVDNKMRIGAHIRDYREFIYELCTLFNQCAAVVTAAAERERKAKEEKEAQHTAVKKEEENDNATAASSSVKVEVKKEEEGSSVVIPSPEAIAEAKKAVDYICDIIMIILAQHSTDVKILSQIVEDRNIETIVDVVQYAIGKRDTATGFVSREARHAMFKDPAKLPAPIVNKIHNFFAVQYLRDLVPQVLEEGDPGGNLPLVSLLLVRARHTMLTELMNADILRNALKTGQSIQHNRGMIAMMLDITTYVKNTSAVGADTKNEVYAKSIELGLMDFIADLFRRELELADSSNMSGLALQQASDCLSHLSMWSPIHCSRWLLEDASSPLRGDGAPRLDPSSDLYKQRHAALGSSFAPAATRNASVMNRSLTPFSSSSGSLGPTAASVGAATPPPPADEGSAAAAAASSPQSSSSAAAAAADVATTVATVLATADAATASAATAAISAVVKKEEEEGADDSAANAATSTNTTCTTAAAAVDPLRAGPNDFSKCPLLLLLFEALAVAKDPVAAQAIGDAIHNVGIGTLQLSAIVPMFGFEVITLRRRILQYWCCGTLDGGVGKMVAASNLGAIPIFTAMLGAANISRLAPENAITITSTPPLAAAGGGAGSSSSVPSLGSKRARSQDAGPTDGGEASGDHPKTSPTTELPANDDDATKAADPNDDDDEDADERRRVRKANRDASLEHDADDGAVHNLPTSSFTRHLRDLNKYSPNHNRRRNQQGGQQGSGARSTRDDGGAVAANGCPLATAAADAFVKRGVRVSSANTVGGEVTELQCLRVLRLLTKERPISCSSVFADLLRNSNLLGHIAAALHPKSRASNKLCCIAVEFLSEVIRTNAARLLQVVISSHVIDAIVRLHETLPRRSSVLSASILSVFNTAAGSVAEARQRQLSGNNNGAGNGGGLGGGFGNSQTSSPYLSRIAASEASATNGGDSSSNSNNAPDLSLVDHILLHYSSYVGYFAPNVLMRLRRVKETNGDDVAGEGSSSAVGSFSDSANRALSETEFQAILAEYGCADGSDGATSLVGRSMDVGNVLSSVPSYEDNTIPHDDDEDDEDDADSTHQMLNSDDDDENENDDADGSPSSDADGSSGSPCAPTASSFADGAASGCSDDAAAADDASCELALEATVLLPATATFEEAAEGGDAKPMGDANAIAAAAAAADTIAVVAAASEAVTVIVAHDDDAATAQQQQPSVVGDATAASSALQGDHPSVSDAACAKEEPLHAASSSREEDIMNSDEATILTTTPSTPESQLATGVSSTATADAPEETTSSLASADAVAVSTPAGVTEVATEEAKDAAAVAGGEGGPSPKRLRSEPSAVSTSLTDAVATGGQ